MKFREMRMVASEPFVDWVLRLENQAKFCDFEADQRKEEFTQALIRRSVPEIATKLYEMSDVFNNDLERLMAHGRHLDYIRMETEEGNQAGKVESEISGEATYGEHVVKPVNAVASQRLASRPRSSGPRLETRSEMDRPTHSRDNRFRGTGFRVPTAARYNAAHQNCPRCGRVHGFKECKAFRAKCYTCGKDGHFSEFCFSRNKVVHQSQRERADHNAAYTTAGKINQVK